MEKDIEYGMVDLGLPSGLKWADRNVGAASPEAFGDYFMWGSVTPDTDNVCDWEHAPFSNGSEDFDEEYFNAHKSEKLNKDVTLKPEYDAANMNMGGTWRMPTSDEIQELIDGTMQTVESLGYVKGMRFTSNANGNSIFMPFSGYRYSSNVYNVGDYGYAWSSSLNAGYDNDSRGLYFDDFGYAAVSNFVSRYDGFVVRGVCYSFDGTDCAASTE